MASNVIRRPRREHFQKLSQLVNASAPWRGILSAAGDMPEAVRAWLARATLLYGIPFDYLVPDEKMLPLESIRFFYIDPIWIQSLLDGALSIGRDTGPAREHDAAMLSAIKPLVDAESKSLRLKLQGRNNLGNADVTTGGDDSTTGFFLRSVLVSGWPGLEVKAYRKKADEEPLVKILRMERLSQDVMLCLFEGEFERLELLEPAESLFFGVDEPHPGKYFKTLRELGSGKNPAGTPMEKEDPVPVSMRDEKLRVLDIKALAHDLEAGLGKAKALGKYFSSAEFAVQMTSGAHKGVFDATNEDGKQG